MGILRVAVALDVANSPSECAIACIAVGENPKGNLTRVPKIVVEVSSEVKSRRTWGRIL